MRLTAVQTPGAEFEFCLGPGNWDIIDGTCTRRTARRTCLRHEWTRSSTAHGLHAALEGAHAPDCRAHHHLPRQRSPVGKEMNSIVKPLLDGRCRGGDRRAADVQDADRHVGDAVVELGEHRYAQGVAYSTSGSIKGPWSRRRTPSKATTPATACSSDVRRQVALHPSPRGGHRTAQAATLERRRLKRQAGAQGPIPLRWKEGVGGTGRDASAKRTHVRERVPYCRRIFSIAFPLASSSMSLSR